MPAKKAVPTKAAPKFELPAKQNDNRVELFSVGDNSFTVPAKISPSTALRMMRTARKHGEEMAVAELLENLLGDQYDAFLDLDLPEDILSQVAALAVAHATGETNPN